ncbi:MAG: Nif3-like dinuclear metal center hexameric protein [Cyclobacteriaceae bacterium]|jgi:dinuclear metal center YbgI/SA1388 family protein
MATTTIKEVANFLESIAPKAYQESYDNSGLLTGEPTAVVKGVLVSLDCTEAVVDEAIAKNCNLIVAHHPIIFKGLKKLTGQNYIERTIIKAIKNDIAIYAIHTNLDNVHTGVNKRIAEKIGLTQCRILQPKANTLMKLTTFVPPEAKDQVLSALHNSGAGQIGEYKNCGFEVMGEGTFQPSENANPTIGTQGKKETVREARIEVLFPEHLKSKIVTALQAAHPYEEVAYYLHRLENENQEVGAGMVGLLPEPMELIDFLQGLKVRMNISTIRYTAPIGRKIQRVAVCGGSGSFLLPTAIAAQADVYVSADFKYHEFFDAEGKIVIADIGHFESEQFTKDLLSEVLKEKFTTFATTFSTTNTNPISYL